MSLEQLWAGWRLQYVQDAGAAENAGGDSGTDASQPCVFCRIADSGPPSPDNGIVWRDDCSFAVLNAYPYASGHLLVMPLRHVEGIDRLNEDEAASLWAATRTALTTLSTAYGPDGLNLGANLGRAAGAGIPRHVHLHVLPRWIGDTNFMTTVAGVRVMPESLTDSWRRLHDAWPSP